MLTFDELVDLAPTLRMQFPDNDGPGSRSCTLADGKRISG